MTCPRVTWKVRVLFFTRDGEEKDALEFAFLFVDARSRFIAVSAFIVIFLHFFVLPSLAALVIKEREREEGKKRSYPEFQKSDRSSLQSPSNRTRAKTRGIESSPFGFSSMWVVFARDDA